MQAANSRVSRVMRAYGHRPVRAPAGVVAVEAYSLDLNFRTIIALLATVSLVGMSFVGGATTDAEAISCDAVPSEADVTVPVSATGADELDGPGFWLVDDYYYDVETESFWREFNRLPGLQTTPGECDSDGDGIADHRYTVDTVLP